MKFGMVIFLLLLFGDLFGLGSDKQLADIEARFEQLESNNVKNIESLKSIVKQQNIRIEEVETQRALSSTERDLYKNEYNELNDDFDRYLSTFWWVTGIISTILTILFTWLIGWGMPARLNKKIKQLVIDNDILKEYLETKTKNIEKQLLETELEAASNMDFFYMNSNSFQLRFFSIINIIRLKLEIDTEGETIYNDILVLSDVLSDITKTSTPIDMLKDKIATSLKIINTVLERIIEEEKKNVVIKVIAEIAFLNSHNTPRI